MYKVLFIINITKDAAELSLSFLVYNKAWNIENIKVITEFIQQEKWQWKSNKQMGVLYSVVIIYSS